MPVRVCQAPQWCILWCMKRTGLAAVALLALGACSGQPEVEPAPVTKSRAAAAGVDVGKAMEGEIRDCQDLYRQSARQAEQTIRQYLDADSETKGKTLREACVELAQWFQDEAQKEHDKAVKDFQREMEQVGPMPETCTPETCG